MKRSFAWFFTGYFIIGSLCPNTDFAQLWHLSSALNHFHDHQTKAMAAGDSFTIWTFIRDHYVDPNSHSHDKSSDHDQLPVKHIHHAIDLILHHAYVTKSVDQPGHLMQIIGFIDQPYSYLLKPGIDRPPSLA